MRIKILKFLVVFASFLFLQWPQLYAQNEAAGTEDIFCKSIKTAILAASDSFAAIRGKFEMGMDGLYDVPYRTYKSKLTIPGSLLNYVMSNTGGIQIEKHIDVFVCNYFMNADSEKTSLAFEKLSSRVAACLKDYNFNTISHTFEKGEGNLILRSIEYEVKKAKRHFYRPSTVMVSFERKHYYDSHAVEGYAVYLRINKN